MISGINRMVDGQSSTFRMGARAMMAIEDHEGKGVVDVLQEFDEGFEMRRLVLLVAECAGDGAGVSLDEAARLVDVLGVTGAAGLIGEVVEAAFPEAAPGKNVKRAARSK